MEGNIISELVGNTHQLQPGELVCEETLEQFTDYDHEDQGLEGDKEGVYPYGI